MPHRSELPQPLLALLEWVEERGLVTTGRDGELYGALSPDWPRGSGTQLLLRGAASDGVDDLSHWFGPIDEPMSDVWPFCRNGADGLMAAVWLAPDSRTRIVHLGSGTGSKLTCVLGRKTRGLPAAARNRLRRDLLERGPARPPVAVDRHDTLDMPFRTWVEATCSTTVPARGTDIISEPAEMGDCSDDVWCASVNAATAPR